MSFDLCVCYYLPAASTAVTANPADLLAGNQLDMLPEVHNTAPVIEQADCDENGNNRNNGNDNPRNPRDRINIDNNNEPNPQRNNPDPNSPGEIRQRNVRQERDRITNRNNIPVEDIHRGFEQLRNSTQIYNNPRIKEEKKRKKNGNSFWNIIILLLLSILAVLFVRKF